jgi:vanillate O-demethylase ferredoxin subunit
MASGLITARVSRKAEEALGIASFELVDAAGKLLPPFSAGSHIDVYVSGGPIRQYSLFGDSAENHRYCIAVLLDPASRGGSRGMHEAVKEGDIIQISAPRNHFPLVHGARESILMAGGIGVTPILCMAERLENTGGIFTMHYCARSPARMAFHTKITSSSYADRVSFHFDDGAPDQRLDLHRALGNPQPDVHLYMCGPPGFMQGVNDVARRQGWQESQMHREYFAGVAAGTDRNEEFYVRIASSGQVISVAADQTVIAALAAHGINVPISCEQGVCGTCLTRILEGEPDHRDAYLTADEKAAKDQFLPCCSRSTSRLLVLDL